MGGLGSRNLRLTWEQRGGSLVSVWGGTWEVRNKMDWDGLWGCCGGEETQVLPSGGRKTGGNCIHRERAACKEHMKGEGRGFEVQLTAVMTVCVFPGATLWLGFVAAGQQPPTTSCVASGCW